MFLVYCVLIFLLAGSVGMIVRCLVSVSRQPSIPKLSAIVAALLACLLFMLLSEQRTGLYSGFVQPLFR